MNKRIFSGVSLLSLAMIGLHAPASLAATYDIRPDADTFVTSAGSGSSYPNIANHNFGGAGSRGVCSASWVGLGQTDPRGYSESLLGFVTDPLVEDQILSMTLDLTITKDMSTGSKNVFNKTGNGGDFDVYLLIADWEQGYDAPESANTTSGFGVTYNSLHDDPAYASKQLLTTLSYDYSTTISGQTQTFDLSAALGNSDLVDLIHSGGAFTLLITPTEGSLTCFNFAAYTQTNGSPAAPGESTIRTAGPWLHIAAVPEPCSLGIGLFAMGWLGSRTMSRRGHQEIVQ